MSPSGDQTSAEVAEEAEHERADLVSTLDQLRENLRPSNMVDEVMSHAKVSSADITDKVWQLARANPLPAALIALGAAMLIGAGQMTKKKAAAKDHDWTRYDPFSARESDGVVSRSKVRTYPTGAGRAAAFDNRFEPVRPSMNNFSNIKHPRSAISRLIDEQPLVLAALGIAVGAAVGSAIPSTDVEAHWMGDASESVRQNATGMAREQLSQLKATAGETLEQMKSTAAEHGVSTDNLSGLVHDLGDHVKTAAASVSQQADRTSRTL